MTAATQRQGGIVNESPEAEKWRVAYGKESLESTRLTRELTVARELLAKATRFRVGNYTIRQYPCGKRILWFALRNDVAHPWNYHTGKGWPTAVEAVAAAEKARSMSDLVRSGDSSRKETEVS
jgi:hypothetical protein